MKTRFHETGASVSPDGRWIAYRSDESGQDEIYVQSFPVPGGKYQVTTAGGIWASWSRDGKALRYGLRSDPTRGLEAEVQAGSEFRLGPPRVIFTTPQDHRGVRPDFPNRSAVNREWREFLRGRAAKPALHGTSPSRQCGALPGR